MLKEQTLSLLHQFRLTGMARGFSERAGRPDHADLPHEAFVGLIVDDERIHRENARLSRLLKKAHFKEPACLEDINYRHPRGLSKEAMLQLSTGEWLVKKQNVFFTGPTGIGKTWLSEALGHQACRLGYTTWKLRFPRLLEELFASRADGSHLKLLSRLAKIQLLILDDFATATLTDLERKDLLEIVEDRHGTGSLILTSQLPTKDWHQAIGEPTLADAICDRLFSRSYRFDLKGKSMRPEAANP